MKRKTLGHWSSTVAKLMFASIKSCYTWSYKKWQQMPWWCTHMKIKVCLNSGLILKDRWEEEGRQNICKLTDMLFLLFSLVFVRPCMTPVNWCKHIIFSFCSGCFRKVWLNWTIVNGSNIDKTTVLSTSG